MSMGLFALIMIIHIEPVIKRYFSFEMTPGQAPTCLTYILDRCQRRLTRPIAGRLSTGLPLGQGEFGKKAPFRAAHPQYQLYSECPPRGSATPRAHPAFDQTHEGLSIPLVTIQYQLSCGSQPRLLITKHEALNHGDCCNLDAVSEKKNCHHIKS